MKHKYIRINDISEIDTSHVSVYDLNNRYIDKTGAMFGLRYNRDGKKIEIIKILRAHADEIQQIQQKVTKTKISKSRGEGDEDQKQNELSSTSLERDEIEFFDPDLFINDTLIIAQTHRQRLKAIIGNIKNSNAILKENKIESGNLDDIFRVLEIDSIIGLEDLDGYQKELQSYPRSVSYYQAKMDKKGRVAIDRMAGDVKKIMRYVYLYEMLSSTRNVYSKLSTYLHNLLDFLEKKEIEEMKQLSPQEKQCYFDAKTSTGNTIAEIEKQLEKCTLLEEHLNKLSGD